MVVWLHPHTNNPAVQPQSAYPFGPPYPYGLIGVRIDDQTTAAAQRFLDIPAFHLLSQHFLAYQLLAARRQAVIVVPVAPSSHFELFTAPGTLMRMLREIYCWLPFELPRGGEAKVYPPPRIVGRVGVSAFSASVPFMARLMTVRSPDGHYAKEPWGGPKDVSDFYDAWREQWAIDGVADGFKRYLDQAAGWVQGGSDRRLRVYKSDFTGGRWLPTAAGRGPGASLVKGATPLTRSSGKLWAQWAADSRDRWHAVSFSNDYVLGPPAASGASPRPQLLPTGPHELMPRICFGHAAGTSGLASAR